MDQKELIVKYVRKIWSAYMGTQLFDIRKIGRI